MSNNVFISPQDNNVSLSTNNNILVITDSDQNQVTVSQPVTNVIQVNTVGPQGTTGQQGIQGPTGSLSSSNSGSFAITGSLTITGSSDITNLTASNALITGNVVVLGTASINTLVVNQTQLSTGSNQLGDAVNDTQTLYGSVRIPTGSLTVTGSILVEQNNPINFGNQINIQRAGTNILYASSAETIVNTISTSSPIRFQIGSSEVARITGSLFGIGTTTPQRRLHIDASGSANTDTPLLLTSVDTNNRVGILFASSSLTSGRQHRLFHRTTNPSVEWLLNTNAGESAVWYLIPRDDTSYSFSLLTPYNGGTVFASTGINQPMLSLGAGGLNNQYINISSSGQVGIGTTSPSASVLLDVSGSVRVSGNVATNINNTYNIGSPSLRFLNIYASSTIYTGGIRGTALNFGDEVGNNFGRFMATTGNFILQNGGTFTDNGYRVQINSTGSDSGSLYISGSSSQPLLKIDSDSASNILFISGSGNVGIGSTSTPGARLEVNGNISIASTAPLSQINSLAVVGGRAQFGWNGTLSSAYIATGDISKNIVFSGDNGLTNIWGKFSANTGDFIVQGFTGSIDNKYRLQIYATGSDSGSLFISGSSSQPLLVVTSSTGPALFVSGSGFVGIGTSSPAYKFQVNGSVYFSGGPDFYVDGTSRFGGTNSYSTVITNSGSIGIGITNPTSRLHLLGSSGSALLRVDSDVSSSILFISGSGRVGIGTFNPIATLDIINHSNAVSSIPIATFRTSGSTGHIALHNWTSPMEIVRIESSNDIASGGSLRLYTLNSGTMTEKFRITNDGQTYIGTGGVIPTARLQVRGIGATSATTTFLLQNSTPTTLMTVLDNSQFTYSGPLLTLGASQSAYTITQSISSSNIVGAQVYGVNITPTFWQTTASQTETAFRVAATFTQSSAAATSGSNIIADFGATSVGSQLTITDVTSGSIYMVNDVSGLPIIEATSDWTVNMYNFPNIVFQKTGSTVNITGSLRVTGSLVMSPTSSFVFPLTSSVSPLTGSAYWSGSLLFIWDGSRYRSSSFA
jgi:hypothetical protein